MGYQSNRMVIRFFSYFYPPCIGGGETILQGQAEGLASRGHTVHVHTTCYADISCTKIVASGTSVENGVQVHRRPSFVLPFHNPLEKDAITPLFLPDSLAQAELLVCVGYPSLHLELLVERRKRGKTPLIVQNYITADFLKEILAGQGGLNKKIRARYWKSWVSHRLKAADCVIADSPGAAIALKQSLGLENVVVHIGMAADPQEFAAVTPEQSRLAKEKLGITRPYILAPSRISRQKGADLLIEAFKRLKRPDLQLVICGPVNEPEFFEQLTILAAPLGNQVRFGELPRELFVALIKGARCVALPSRGETVGGVVFEAMLAGVPVVVSDAVEAAREDYMRGLPGLFAAESVPALEGALKEVLEASPEARAARVQAGKSMVEQRFTWEASVDRLQELYLKVVEKSHA
jgi:glycosyltransferase involved in cell wall biosynthesis